MNSGDNTVRKANGGMHPAPSLTEAPPTKSTRTEYPRSGQHALQTLSVGIQSPGQGSSNNTFFDSCMSELVSRRGSLPRSRSASPPSRKDTELSTATSATSNSLVSSDTAATTHSIASSPSAIPGQNLFSVANPEGGEGSRPNRRRTGPLNPEQRRKAAIIRKVGACDECRRRRVACQPEHHGISWAEAEERYAPNGSPPRQEPTTLSPVQGFRPTNAGYKRTSQEMDDDSASPTRASSDQPPLKSRKPLPTAPRPLERTAQAVLSLSPDVSESSGLLGPAISSPRPADPSSTKLRPLLTSSPRRIDPPSANVHPYMATRDFSGPELHRYIAVHVLLLSWEDEGLDDVKRVTEDLRRVFEEQYNYTCEMACIPHYTEPFGSSRWLLDRVGRFSQHLDRPNVLKILYYNGHTYIDRDRDMILSKSVPIHPFLQSPVLRCIFAWWQPIVLAGKKRLTPFRSSLRVDRACNIKWKGIQAILEQAVADTIVLMDCPYLGPRVSRQDGIMTVLASCDFDDYGNHPVPRCLFTKRLVANLRTYARQLFRGPSYTTGLAADILTDYLTLIPDARTDCEALTKFPHPLHLTLSGHGDVPIMLAPLPQGGPSTPPSTTGSRSVSVRLDYAPGEEISVDELMKWIRRLPRGVRNVQIQGPYPLGS